MKIKLISLDSVQSAPWRFSEDMRINHGELRYYSPIQHNIELSLAREGQIAPIHVRGGLNDGVEHYEIVDGHIVVDAARKLGWKSIEAIVHEKMDWVTALHRYVMLNLNRCGQYGHYHVKIHRVFAELWPKLDAQAKAAKLQEIVSWPADRVLDYVELGERDENWQKFMFVPKDDGEQTGFFDSTEPDPVPDSQ